MTADDVTLTLVNVNQVEARVVVVQGGAYGEHQIESVTISDQIIPVQNTYVTIHLAPGCGSSMVIKMSRYANQPTCSFPWDR